MIEENSGPAKSVPLSEVSHLVSVPLTEVLLYIAARQNYVICHLQLLKLRKSPGLINSWVVKTQTDKCIFSFLPEENAAHHQRIWWPLHPVVFQAKENIALCTIKAKAILILLWLLNYSFSFCMDLCDCVPQETIVSLSAIPHLKTHEIWLQTACARICNWNTGHSVLDNIRCEDF